MATGFLSAESLRNVRTQAGLWFIETRPKFLVGSVAVALLGTTIAWWDGFFSLPHAVLAFIGLLLWHISVQVLNDYYDYRSGVDLKTKRTPFSGGSGILPARLLEAESVFKFGLLSFTLAVPIWIYLIIDKGLLLLPLLAVQAVCVLLYTPHLARWRMGEVSCGLGIGTLPILMFYFVQTGVYTADVVVAAMPSGILFFNVHLLNAFPDVEADKLGKKKTLPIILGRVKAAWLYIAGTVAVYAWVVAWVAVGIMPLAALFCLVTMPLAIWAIRGALSYRDEVSFTPALWANALVLLVTLALLAFGYIVDRL